MMMASEYEDVTEAMLREEQALEAESRQKEEQSKEEGDTLAAATHEQRLHRLKHLLEKSSLYSEFLFNRMKQQEQERAAKAARAKKKAEKKGTVASTAAATAGGGGEKGKGSKRKGEPVLLADYATEADLLLTDGPEHVAAATSSSSAAVGGVGGAGPAAEDTFSRTLADGRKISDMQPGMVTGGVLRDYQLKGVEWLTALYENGLNGILADEMGLGKTVQVICFLAHLYEKKVRGPYLIVTPLSTVHNWVAELRRFAPRVPVILYHGTPAERAEKRAGIMQDRKDVGYATVVTSFEVVMNDRRFLANLPWKYLVVDEGHRIKNLNCRLIRDLKTFQSANRMLLTGTPLQNNLAELWSLLNFLLPDIFDDLDSFQRWFDFTPDDALLAKEEEEHILAKLHLVLKPFLLRRLKTDVELSIPPKKEVVLFAPLTHKQESFYKGILNRTILEEIAARSEAELGGGAEAQASKRRCSEGADYREIPEHDKDTPQRRVAAKEERKAYVPPSHDADVHVRLQNILMQLRKCCNHPYLLEYPLTATGDYLMDEGLITSCGKMQVLDRVLPELQRRKHKVLIFSQMTKMLDVLQDYCWLRKYEYVRLDGSVSFHDRQQRIEAFNSDENVFIFLLSTRAGGLGLNLMAADTVIIYDSDWNPQADLQAQDRCHRIGQTKPVLVMRLITANTVDQRILQRAEAKRKLEKLVIHRGRFKGREQEDTALTSTELLELLSADSANEVACDDSHQAISDEALRRALDRTATAPTPAAAADFHVL